MSDSTKTDNLKTSGDQVTVGSDRDFFRMKYDDYEKFSIFAVIKSND